MIKEIEMRIIASNRSGRWGVLIDKPGTENIPFCVTGELPWNDNENYVSSIPISTYDCILLDNNKYHVRDVSGRSEITIEIANCPLLQLEGCIAVGEKYEKLWNHQAVQESKNAFDELKARAGDFFRLRMLDCTK